MTIINLRDYYPWYIEDQLVEVPDEVAEALRSDKLYESAHRRRAKRNKVQYSLDCDDGIEYSACISEPTPEELLERKEKYCRLCYALNTLPEAQGRRIDACIILGKSVKEVANAEGVDESSVRQSIQRGLQNMRKII